MTEAYTGRCEAAGRSGHLRRSRTTLPNCATYAHASWGSARSRAASRARATTPRKPQKIAQTSRSSHDSASGREKLLARLSACRASSVRSDQHLQRLVRLREFDRFLRALEWESMRDHTLQR